MGNAFMRWLQEQQRKGRDAGQKAQQNNRQNKTRAQQQASGQQMMQNMRQNQQNKQQGEKNQRQNNQRQNGQRQNGQSRGQRQNQPQRQPQNYATAPTSPRAAAAQRQRFQHSTFANPEENRRRAQKHRTRGMPDYAYEVAGQQDKPNAADSVLGIPAFEIDENKLDRASNIPLINTFATWRKAYGSNPIEAADPLDYLQQITDRYLAPNDAEKAVQGMAQQAVETRAAKHTWGGIPGLSTIANDFDSGQAAKREQTMQEVLTLAQQTPTSGLYQNEYEKKNARSQMAASLSMTGQNTNTFPRGAVGKLTEQELDTLVYLERIGMNDWSKNNYVNLYAKHIAEDVSKRQDEALAAYLESDDANPLGKAGARVLLGADNIMQNAVATPQYAYDVLEGSLNYVLTGDKSPVSENSFGSKGMRDANKAAELALHDTSEVGRFVGQGVMSGVNSAANMVMFGPKGGAIAMGVQAGAGSAYDTAQKGGDVTQQLSTGIASGAAESLMEYVSFGVLDDIIKSPVGKKTILEFMKKMGAQVGTEAATEALTELSNIGSELVLLGEKSDLASVYNEYLNRNNAQANAMEAFHGKEITDEQRAAVKRLREKGTDKNGALLAALQYTLQRSGYAAAQGAFMGGIMGGGGTALNFARTPSKAKVAFDESVRAQTMQALNNPIASSQHPATGVNAYAQKQQELAAEVERVQVQRQEQAALQQQTQQAQQWAQNQPPEVQSAMQQALDEGAPPDIAMGLAAQNAEQRAAVQANAPTIENAGQRGYTTSNPATAFTDTNGGANNGRDILLYGGSQWQAGAHSREPGGRMAGVAGKNTHQYLDGRGQTQNGRNESGIDENFWPDLRYAQNGATYPSAEEAALSFAQNAVEVDTFAGKVQAIPEGVYTPEMHQLKESYAQRGVDVEYIASPIVTKTGFRAAGAYENGVMLVYASSERGIENVAAHEYFHHKFGKEQTDAAIDVLKKNMSVTELKDIIDNYMTLYDKEYDGDMDRIYEEIAADHYAENEAVQQLVDGNAENTTHATGEASKKDVRYSGSRDKGKQPKPPNIFSHLTPEVVQRINADLEASRALEAGSVVNSVSMHENANYGTLAPYSSQEVQNLTASEKNLVSGVNADLSSFINYALQSKGQEKTLYLGKIPNDVATKASDIAGSDVSGYSFVITNGEIKKIFKDHGNPNVETPRGQVAVTPEILGKLVDVVSMPDNIVLGKPEHGKPALQFEKRINGYAIYVQAVSDKGKKLRPITFYVINKKKPPTMNNANGPAHHALDASGTVSSAPNIPPAVADVKTKNTDLEASRALEAGIGTQMDAPTIEKPTAINTVADEHSRVSQQEIDKYVNAVDPDMVEFVKRVKGGERGTSHTVSPVNAREVADIQRLTGIDTTGFNHVLGANQLADHIQKRHGQGGKADSSMRYDEDLARMGYVLENYDTVQPILDKKGNPVMSPKYLDKNHSRSPLIRYEKAVDGTYYVAEVVPDTRKNALYITSSYIGDKKNNNSLRNAKLASINVQNGTAVLSEGQAPRLDNHPRGTPENAVASSSTPNIPPESDVVKEEGTEKKGAAQPSADDIFYAPTRAELTKRNALTSVKVPAQIKREMAGVGYKQSRKDFAKQTKDMPWFGKMLFNQDAVYSAQNGPLQGRVTDRTVRKNQSYSTPLGERQLAILPVLDKIFENGLVIQSRKSRNPESKISTVHTLLSPVVFEDGTQGIVKLNVLEHIDPNAQNRIHDNKLLGIIKEPEVYATPPIAENQQRSNRLSGSTVSIEEMLDFVNNTEYEPEGVETAKDAGGPTTPQGKKPQSPIQIAKTPKSEAQTNAPKKPKASKEKSAESRTKDTLKGYSIFDDSFKKLALQDYGVTSYDRIANPEAMEKANSELNKGGAAAANVWWASKESSPENIATGIILMNRYQAVGDYESMVATMQHIRELSTKGAQTIQAMSLMGRMTPEGMVYYGQKSLTQAYEEMVRGKNEKWIANHKSQFELTGEDIEFIQTKTEQAASLPESRDKHILLGEIAARIQNKIPPAPGQSLKALARISMLLNPKTHVRNILGNTIILPQNILSDFVGSGLDKAISAKTGVRTMGAFKPSSLKGMGKGAYESFDDFRRKINTRDMGGDRYEIGQSMNFGNKTKMGKALNALDRVSSFLLDAGDRPFFEMWFVNSMNNQLTLNSATEPTAAMVDIATTEALQRTWQDTNNYTKFVQQVRNGLNNLDIKGYGLGDVVMPFIKTPANLTKAVIDYSPISLVKAITHDSVALNRAIKTNSVTPQMQRQFVKNLSQGVAGTLLYVVFAALVKEGVITAGADEDKDVANFMKNVLGEQPYSVNIGDKSFSYTWAQPLATAAAISADVINSSEGNGKQYVKSESEVARVTNLVLSAIQSGGSVLYEQSFLQGLQNLFKSDNLVSGLMDAALGEPAKFTPQFLGQLAQLADGTQRQTYAYGQPLETAKNKVLAKIPFASGNLEPVVDTFGREVRRHGGDNGVFNVFLNPANVQTENMNAAGREVQRLYEATGDTRAMPRVAPYYLNKTKEYPRHDMSAKERTQYQKIAGKQSEQGVLSLLRSTEYQALSDAEKVDALEEVYSDAADLAREAIRTGATAGENTIDIQNLLDGVRTASGETPAGQPVPAADSANAPKTTIPKAVGIDIPNYKQPTLDLIAAFGVSTEDWAYVEDRLPAAENKVEQILDWGFTGLPLQGLVEHQVMGETAQAKLLTATEMGIDKETYIDGYVFGYTSKGTKAQRNQQIYEYVDELPRLTQDQRAKLYEWLKVSKGSGEYSGSSGDSSGSSSGRRRGRRSSKKASTRKKKASKTEEEAEYEKGLAFVKFARAAAKKQPQVKGDQNLSFGEELLKKKAAIKQAVPDSFPEQNSVFYKAILENAKKKGGKR